VDIDDARSDLARAPGFSYLISYDLQADTLVRQEISLADHQQFYRRIIAVDEAARQLVITDARAAQGLYDLHRAWSAAIGLAATHHLLLWSDDVAVRSIAANAGVSAFGTYALLAALTEVGLIPDTRDEDTLILERAHIVQLPRALS